MLRNNSKELNEHQIQCQFVNWFKAQYPKYHLCIIAIPNAGKRSYKTASYFKAEGLLSGTSDILITMPGRKRMLWIEFKAKKGVLSKQQIDFIDKHKSIDCECAVCYSVDEAIKAVINYIT